MPSTGRPATGRPSTNPGRCRRTTAVATRAANSSKDNANAFRVRMRLKGLEHPAIVSAVTWLVNLWWADGRDPWRFDSSGFGNEARITARRD